MVHVEYAAYLWMFEYSIQIRFGCFMVIENEQGATLLDNIVHRLARVGEGYNNDIFAGKLWRGLLVSGWIEREVFNSLKCHAYNPGCTKAVSTAFVIDANGAHKEFSSRRVVNA